MPPSEQSGPASITFRLEAGQTAPAFTVPDQDGRDDALADLAGSGKTVVLFFYPKADTPG